MVLVKAVQLDGSTARAVVDQGGVQHLVTVQEGGVPVMRSLGRPYPHDLGFWVEPFQEFVSDAFFVPVVQPVEVQDLSFESLKGVFDAVSTGS